MLRLRPYQESAVEDVRRCYAVGRRAVLLVSPTGSGKTVTFGFVTSSAAARGKRVLILCHRRELIRQASRKLTEAGVRHGIIAPGHQATRDLVQVASVQTLGRRLDRLDAYDLIVIDEAHHAVAGQWARIIAAQPGARLLGVTATPERLDGRGLGIPAGGVFDDLVMGPSVAELIAGGHLTPARIFAPADQIDLSGVRTKGGDYEAGALAAVMNAPGLTGDAVAHYAKLASGQPAIAFCASVAHAEAVAATFRAQGWRAAAASGDTPAADRDGMIAGLSTGRTQVLCTCDLISEGLDVPAVGAVILLRPTQSLGLHLQQIGRGLRPAPGKAHLVVLDHAGNTLRLGPPEMEHAWSLEGRPKRDRKALPNLAQCPKCFAVHAPKPACPCCGHAYAAPARAERELETREGELAEVQAERLAHLRRAPLHTLLAGATDRAALEEIRKARGYHPRWIRHVMREQRERAPA